MTTPRQSLHRRNHSLIVNLLAAATAALHVHGHLLSCSDTEAHGHLQSLYQHLDHALQDRREITRLLKNMRGDRP
jgi:hypothetical protein